MQSVNENAQVNKIARMADRYIEVGRTSCPESRREYRGNEETNSIFMSTIKMFALCKSSNDLDMMSKIILKRPSIRDLASLAAYLGNIFGIRMCRSWMI
jgi:hypothetical protein